MKVTIKNTTNRRQKLNLAAGGVLVLDSGESKPADLDLDTVAHLRSFAGFEISEALVKKAPTTKSGGKPAEEKE